MKRFIIIIACLLFTNSAFAWSRALHNAIAAIANDNLTEQAKSNINKALGGHNIIYSAQWMYDVAEEKGYEQTKNWRSVAFNKTKLIKGKKIAKHPENIVNRACGFEALTAAISAIESGKLSEQELADNIRYIVTIMGDLHCPTHYIFTDILEKRKSYYIYDNKKRPYVTYWESDAVRGTFAWRTSEFVHQLSRLTPEQVSQVTAGSVTDWIVGNVPLYRDVFGMIDTGTRFDKNGLRRWQNKIYPIAIDQITVAGYRLAAVLNSLFDTNAPKVTIK